MAEPHPVSKFEQPPADPRVSRAEVISFVRRHGLQALLFAVAAGVLAALVLFVLLPAQFDASCNLVVVSPGFASALNPNVLTMQAYQALLESDAVVAETNRRLREENGTWKAGYRVYPPKVGMRSEIFISARQDSTSLAPLLRLVGSAETPERAAAIANTWAEVFLEMAQDLIQSTTSPTVRFLESQYPKTREELTAKEDEKLAVGGQFQARRDEILTASERRIDAAKRERADALAAYRSETRTLMESFLQSSLARLGVDAGPEAAARVRSALASLVATRTELAQSTQILSLQRPIDSLIVTTDLPSPQAPPAAGLSEEINPAYAELVLKVVEDERALETASQGVSVTRIAAGVAKLQQERSAGLVKLEDKYRSQLQTLERRTESDLETLERERLVRLSQLDRQLTDLRNIDSKLSENYNEALLAKADDNVENVHLAAPAVASEERRDLPEKRMKTVFALILGGLIGLFVSWFRSAPGS